MRNEVVSVPVRASRLVAVGLAMLVAIACNSTEHASNRVGPFIVEDAWARAADSGATGAVYLTLRNVDSLPASVASLSTPVAVAAELHETTQHDGMIHMVQRPAISIAPDSLLHMAPGGLHVMLIELKQELIAGDKVALTVELGDGRRVPVTAAVRAP